ncbi:MAG TPA: GNAT family protein [Propionibacteriaceae bacterium]|nr:GNAT family protein [Propionibacteriaceae bacterium]
MPGPGWPMPDGVELPDRPAWPVRLRAGSVGLRRLLQRDADGWVGVRARNARWLAPWDATPPPEGDPGPGSFAEMVRMLNRQARAGSTLPWAITWDAGRPWRPLAPPSPVIGQLTVSGITYGSARWAQIGYWIDRDHAGRGIVPVSVALACDYCFGVLELHRIEIDIRPENTNSLRVVEKLGFRPEGMRPAYLHIAGDWRDHLTFALHRDDVPEGLLVRYLDGRPLPGVNP